MKKVISVIAFSVFLLAFALPIFAHDAVTYAEWGTPEIDGVKEAVWDSAQKIDVADESIEDVGDETATAEVWSLWDGDYVYFYAIVKDKTVDAEYKDDAWNQDAVGFMIDYAYNREPEVNYRDLGDESYAGYVNVCAVEGTKNYPESPTIFGEQAYIDGVKSYCKLTDTGYEIEIRLPLLYKDYVAGDKLGYEICDNNSIGDGVRASQTVWAYADGAEGNESWRYTYNMGTLILNSKPVETEAVAETEEPAVEVTADTEETTAPQTSDVISYAAAFIVLAGFVTVVAISKKNRK